MELLRIVVYILLSLLAIIAMVSYIHIKLHKGWEMFVDIRIYDPLYNRENTEKRLTEKEESVFRQQIAKKFRISLTLAHEAIVQSRRGNSKWFKQFNKLDLWRQSKDLS